MVRKAKPFSISLSDDVRNNLVSYCSTNNLNRSAFVSDVVNRAITSSYCSTNSVSYTTNSSDVHRNRKSGMYCEFKDEKGEND
jgi:hypothetical protein